MLTPLRRAGIALLIPRLAWLSHQAPPDATAGWNRYWSAVRATGRDGDVLWDSGSEREWQGYLEQLNRHFDKRLPVVDVGCGNGRFTRLLSHEFPHALGVDLSPAAVVRAEQESRGLATVAFRAVDGTAPGAGQRLRPGYPGANAETDADAGCNVFVRGVFHVLDLAARRSLAENLAVVLGDGGRLFLAETNFPGTRLAYLQHLGVTPWRIPRPLERAIASVPAPERFGGRELRDCFPAESWDVLDQGDTTIDAIPLHGRDLKQIPGYWAVLARRPAAGSLG